MAAETVERDMGAYYARRAVTYERIYAKPERQADLRALEALLPDRFAGRRVLEIACGTGWWTPHGARDAAAWLATDLNEETLQIARRKPMPPCVQFQALDAMRLQPLSDGGGLPFDAAFAGFWWSHLSLSQVPSWLALLHGSLAPGARVVMLDNRHVEGSSTPVSRMDDQGNCYQLRMLDDGSTHEVLKNFPKETEARASVQAAARLGGHHIHDLRWHELQHYWLLDYTF